MAPPSSKWRRPFYTKPLLKVAVGGYRHSYWPCDLRKLGYVGSNVKLAKWLLIWRQAFIQQFFKTLLAKYSNGQSWCQHWTSLRVTVRECEGWSFLNRVPNCQYSSRAVPVHDDVVSSVHWSSEILENHLVGATRHLVGHNSVFTVSFVAVLHLACEFFNFLSYWAQTPFKRNVGGRSEAVLVSGVQSLPTSSALFLGIDGEDGSS